MTPRSSELPTTSNTPNTSDTSTSSTSSTASTAPTSSASDEQGRARWSDLFGPEHRSVVLVLAGGVLLYAMNVYLTSSLLPTVVADIGGERLYAWATTAFLVASVIASLLVVRVVSVWGVRRPYMTGFAIFAVGSVAAALAPSMPVLLVGRTIQGAGGGLLAGLAFAVIRRTLPARLWSRTFGLTSAMWGVGNIVGPSIGGLFAQLGLWRWAMGLLVLLALALGTLARVSMPGGAIEGETPGFPLPAVVAVVVAAGAVSVAGVLHGPATWVLLAVAVVCAILFVVRERRSSARVLPAITYRTGNPLRWLYLGLAILAIGSTTETFIPLFGQQIGGLPPLPAGLLGAALSWGWSVGAIAASSVDAPRRRALLRMTGPVLLALGLAAYAALQVSGPSPFVIVAWFVTLFVGGVGIGSAFQHGITAVMSSTDDETEAARASTGVNTVQLMSNAIGSAGAGLLVNLAAGSATAPARLLLFSYAGLALVGAGIAAIANRRLRTTTRHD